MVDREAGIIEKGFAIGVAIVSAVVVVFYCVCNVCIFLVLLGVTFVFPPSMVATLPLMFAMVAVFSALIVVIVAVICVAVLIVLLILFGIVAYLRTVD